MVVQEFHPSNELRGIEAFKKAVHKVNVILEHLRWNIPMRRVLGFILHT